MAVAQNFVRKVGGVFLTQLGKRLCQSHPALPRHGALKFGNTLGEAKFIGLSSFHTSSVPSKNSEISRYPIPPRETLPEDIQEQLKEVEEKSGFLPNVFQTLSYRPDEFRAFFNYYDVVMAERGNLTKADKEMIVIATSAPNNCLYCIISHGALFRIYSKNPYLADQVAANWRTADLDDRQRAILDFATIVGKCDIISEEKFQNLEKHGLDRDDAWDIGSVAAFFAMSNRLAFLSNMKPNKEFYLLGRLPREKKA